MNRVSIAGPIFMLWLAFSSVPPLVALAGFGHGSIFLLEPFLLQAFLGGATHALFAYRLSAAKLGSMGFALVLGVIVAVSTTATWLLFVSPGIGNNHQVLVFCLAGVGGLSLAIAVGVTAWYVSPKLQSAAQ